MYQGKLQPVAVPWAVSPSVAGLILETAELGHTVVAFNVMIPPEISAEESSVENPRVAMTLRGGLCVRTHIAFQGVDIIGPAWFEPDNRVGVQDKAAHDAERERWLRTKCAPRPGVYEVVRSQWLVSEKMDRLDLRHVVIEGTEIWVEVLCKDWSWTWI